jgi:hypothetical protein
MTTHCAVVLPAADAFNGQEKEYSSLVPDNILEQADLAQPKIPSAARLKTS